jgi:arylsulfatase A-like enzyme
MFGELVALLERKGALQNAIVIVLSDHGEALGLLSDSFFDETFRVEGLRAPLKMTPQGHGQSVLSKSQYQVLLSFRDFGGDSVIGRSGRDLALPATVEDIAPTLLDFAGVPGDPLAVTGQSLLPVLQTGVVPAGSPERIRFTETDLAVMPAPDGGVDEVATARQNSKFFEVDPKTARLHLKPKLAPLATAYKERAAFTKNYLLAAMPAGPYAHQYLYIDLERSYGRLLLERPLDDELPEAQRLWDAMSEHYAGELQPAVSITPEDWPRIGHEWETFLQVREEGRSVAAASPDSG